MRMLWSQERVHVIHLVFLFSDDFAGAFLTGFVSDELQVVFVPCAFLELGELLELHPGVTEFSDYDRGVSDVVVDVPEVVFSGSVFEAGASAVLDRASYGLCKFALGVQAGNVEVPCVCSVVESDDGTTDGEQFAEAVVHG